MSADNPYWLTVEWCNNGKRGLFMDRTGCGYRKDDAPHTADEAIEILGPFAMILSPGSIQLTEELFKDYKVFTPLAEYSYAFGIVTKREPHNAK